jgi:hypothetical protein
MKVAIQKNSSVATFRKIFWPNISTRIGQPSFFHPHQRHLLICNADIVTRAKNAGCIVHMNDEFTRREADGVERFVITFTGHMMLLD